MSGASTMELWAALVAALFVAFVLGTSFGYILAIRQMWGAIGVESIVGQDVSEEPSFLRGQQIPPVERIPYASALKDVR